MSAVAERRLTLDEFYRDYEGRRAYLIDGVPYLMSPAGQSHADGVLWLAERLRDIAPAGVQVREEKPLETGGPNDLEPDIALVRRELGGIPGHHPVAADTLLVVEVSDSSLRDDRRLKLPKYAAAGIAESWVVNLNAGELEVYREPKGESYSTREIYRRGDRVRPLFGGEVLVEEWVSK